MNTPPNAPARDTATPPHGRSCDCPMCRVYMDGRLSSLATALKPCPRCARRARWARIFARAAVPVSIGAAIGAMIPTP